MAPGVTVENCMRIEIVFIVIWPHIFSFILSFYHFRFSLRISYAGPF